MFRAVLAVLLLSPHVRAFFDYQNRPASLDLGA